MRAFNASSFASSLVFYGTIALLAAVEPAGADPGKPGCDAKTQGAAGGCEMGAGASDPAGAAASSSEGTAGEKVYVLGIEGMMCPTNCAPTVKESIESIEGVKSAEVDFEKKQAVVRTDRSVDLTTKEIDESFQNKGYFVSSLEARSAK